jgi:hypothetical protein
MTQRSEPVIGLRDYFRELDRVAPADDQLGAVLARTAAVRQRPGWQTRLPRIDALGALGRQAPLRHALVALAALLLSLAVGLPGGAPGSPFAGRWTSIDPGDGSTQLLDVAGGPNPSVRFEDLAASGCAANGDDSIDFIAQGRGVVTGGRLVVEYPDGGGCHTWHVQAFTSTFTLEASGTALRDADGLVWHRIR